MCELLEHLERVCFPLAHRLVMSQEAQNVLGASLISIGTQARDVTVAQNVALSVGDAAIAHLLTNHSSLLLRTLY